MTGPRRVRPAGDLFHRRLPPGAVYVGRPGRWGNPFKIEEFGLAESRRLFRRYLSLNPELVARARIELAGRDLGCWCPEDAVWCHADDWLRIALANGWQLDGGGR